MRIQSIQPNYYATNRTSNVVKKQENSHLSYQVSSAPAFKGKAGTILGILAGGAAMAAIAALTAPVLICGSALAGAAGGLAGDAIEDKITGKDNENK